MGSPPKRLQPLIDSDKSYVSTKISPGQSQIISQMTLKGNRSLGNLSSIKFKDHPSVYGPHASIAVKTRSSIEAKKGNKKNVVVRPLSSLQTLKKAMHKPEVYLSNLSNLSIYLSVCLSVCLYVCLSVCLSVNQYLSVYLFLSLSLSFFLSLSVCLSLFIYLYLSLYLSICISLRYITLP